jgi:hypothetical protein
VASILYSAEDFPRQPLLVEDSLYETLYRFQEARWGLRDHTEPELASGIDWLRSRLAQPSPRLQWHRTDCDRERTGHYRKPSGEFVPTTTLKLPTGEAAISFSLTLAHIFLSSTPADDPDHALVRDNLLDIYPGPRLRPEPLSAGTFCCPPCTTQYQLALSRASPNPYAKQEPRFIESLRASRSGRRR